MSPYRPFRAAAPFALLGSPRLFPFTADPLSKKTDIDFYRDVPSRELHGLATRSDGRIVPGPVLTELTGPALGELLWTLEPAGGRRGGWWAPGPKAGSWRSRWRGPATPTREVARLDRAAGFRRQVAARWFAARRHFAHRRALPRQGRQSRRAGRRCRSIRSSTFSSCRPPATQNPEPKTQIQEPARFALVATGNPGRIYRVDLAKFAPRRRQRRPDRRPKALAEKGITVFGEIRDRNVRRLARLADGRIAAGSAPHGNVYVFPAGGGAPMILQENSEAEVTDLLPQPNGDLYATIVFSAASGENASPGRACWRCRPR